MSDDLNPMIDLDVEPEPITDFIGHLHLRLSPLQKIVRRNDLFASFILAERELENLVTSQIFDGRPGGSGGSYGDQDLFIRDGNGRVIRLQGPRVRKSVVAR